jgi:hypothetical protein
MVSDSEIASLASLDFISYIDSTGQIPQQAQGKVGVFAIFDQAQTLQFIGYSRDVFLSLQQLLVRQPQVCYWLKMQTIDRPNRTLLEAIREAWITENGHTPPGNVTHQPQWEEPIDVKALMTTEEQASLANAMDEITQAKLLKNVARRVETEILASLANRGLQMPLRFNPKLKEVGLLDLK